MATPPRHITLTGLPAILLVHYIHTWWAWVVGCIFAFAGHTLVDWVCNEYWERKPWQSIVLGASCLVPMIVVYYFAVPVFGWPLLLVMTIMALGQDIIDGIIEVASKWQRKMYVALFPNHWASLHYIPPIGPEESFWITVSLEVSATIVFLLVVCFL
jgi:hypothetical protein